MLTAFTKLQTRVATRDRGATAVEYGIMVALIAIGITVAVIALRTQLNTLFNTVTNNLKSTNGAAG